MRNLYTHDLCVFMILARILIQLRIYLEKGGFGAIIKLVTVKYGEIIERFLVLRYEFLLFLRLLLVKQVRLTSRSSTICLK